jgi:VCBS repeat-containing protein
VNDAYGTDEDTALNILLPGVLANDSDIDGNGLTAQLAAGPAHGSLTLNPNGSFAYTPAANYNGPDSFTYRANDGATNSAPALVSITVRPINDAPVALNDAYSTDEDTPLVVSAPGVLANDSDTEGAAITAILVEGPARGTLELNASGSLTYTPDTNFHGSDSFTYKVSDGAAESAAATVSITVRPVTDTPVANNDNYSTDEDVALIIGAPGVLANDTDGDGDALTALLVSNPAHGSLVLNANGSFTYTPNADYYGADSFSYRASDGAISSGVATVTILVIPRPDPRRTSDDSHTILEDTTLTVSAPGILGNDLSVDGDVLLAFLAQGTLHGTLTLNSNGGFTYVPEPNFNGEDSFIYRAAELLSDSTTSRVSIIIRPVNDAPSFTKGPNHFAPQDAGPQTVANWAKDVSTGPPDEAAQTLTFLLGNDQPSLFSVQPAISADGTLTYAPTPGAHGHANVTVVLKDDGGTLDNGVDTSGAQTFVIGINAPPIANIIVPTNGSVFIAPANIAIIAQGSDLDGVVTNLEIFAGATRLFAQPLAPYEFAWTNVPIGDYTLRARATDDIGATGESVPVGITVLERPPILIVEPMHLNLQSGLFEQRVRVLNPTPFDFEGVRVLVTDLPPDASVYNRSGLTNDAAYVQHNLPVPAGGSIDLVIEYYVPDRVPPNPTLRAEVVRAAAARGDVMGELQTITRHVRLANGTFMIEWVSLRNRTYFVQYGDDLYNWKTVVPPVIGTGTRQQWIDNGPPKTESLPSDKPCRFYRVVLVP